jgi:membrane-bound metal-dependent hydrolase YbcI (DUF457 family)
MRLEEHLIYSFVLYVIFFNNYFILIGIILGTLLPDVDVKNYALLNLFNLPFKFSKHREITHTIWFLILIIAPMICFINMFPQLNYIIIGLIVGFFSHLYLDSLTISGIKPLYPLFNFRIRGNINTFKDCVFLYFLIPLVLPFKEIFVIIIPLLVNFLKSF